jgi:hypothetical protein
MCVYMYPSPDTTPPTTPHAPPPPYPLPIGSTGGDVRDGAIYYADMDSDVGTPISLVPAIGQAHVIDPHGIAIHYKQLRIYWTDKNVTGRCHMPICQYANMSLS